MPAVAKADGGGTVTWCGPARRAISGVGSGLGAQPRKRAPYKGGAAPVENMQVKVERNKLVEPTK